VQSRQPPECRADPDVGRHHDRFAVGDDRELRVDVHGASFPGREGNADRLHAIREEVLLDKPRRSTGLKTRETTDGYVAGCGR
jgi:hypothetical protein